MLVDSEPPHASGRDLALTVFKLTKRIIAALLLPLSLAACTSSSGGTEVATSGGESATTGGATTTSGSGGAPASTNDTGVSNTSSGVGTTGSTALGGAAGSTTGTATTGMSTGGSGGTPATTSGTTDGSATTGTGGTSPADTRDTYFRDWPDGTDPGSVGRRLAEVFDDTELAGSKHYKEACAWYGALEVAGLLGEQVLLDSLVAKYQPYANTWDELLAGAGHVDENVFGIVPLEIALQTSDATVLAEGLSIADHQQANIESQKRFAIDDMFMITSLEVQAFRASRDAKYVDLASSVMVEYLDRLQQEDGLFQHHETFFPKWGRGNGWFAAGMAELIRELPEDHTNYTAIRSGYELMMQGLLGYQLTDGDGAGLWQQVVDSSDERNWPETSGSAMFAYALVSGVRRGWLDVETYGPAARAAWLALVAKLTPEALLQDISDWAYLPSSHEGGPSYAGDEENYYFERPKVTGDNHGQAPMLWSAAALARPLE